MVIYFTVFAFTWWSFGELSIIPLAQRALTASMDAVTFSIVDSIVRDSQEKKPLKFILKKCSVLFFLLQIYGNWLYPLVSLIFFPLWITYFSVLCIRDRSIETSKLKTN